MQCTKCGNIACSKNDLEHAPKGCPSVDFADEFRKAKMEYEKSDIRKIHQAAAHVEVTGYMQWPRVKELMVFCEKMGYKKLGIAFCIGLKEEAKVLTQILEKDNFIVYSGMCTSGALQKKEIDIPDEDTFTTAEEVGCNPIGQAFYLNAQKTDINIVVGLCIGHDINFIKYSKAPTTVLIVKDRVTTHNPAAVLYSRYYKNKYFDLDF
ncbi:MAG: DUF1847 domain-containing protein [Asgard group archaeon]|nr:DUF1847 domain-containing protein [Asgard group archaeon]